MASVVVVAKNPATVKFVDPLPAASSRSQIEDAAIKMSRKLLSGNFFNEDYRKNITALFVDLLVTGTPLDPKPSEAEQEKQIFNDAKHEEIKRLAKEEAKAQREAVKAADKAKLDAANEIRRAPRP